MHTSEFRYSAIFISMNFSSIQAHENCISSLNLNNLIIKVATPTPEYAFCAAARWQFTSVYDIQLTLIKQTASIGLRTKRD
jgi:hypothetical protein